MILMVKVSSPFKKAIYGPERKINSKVSFEIVDVEAYEDASITVSDVAPISRDWQVINKMRNMTHKYASFERDYFKLDGNSYLPPTPDEGESELGWWSEGLSGDTGIFEVRPVLEFTFASPHDSVGLTITFDTITNQYATDFTIEAFDGVGTMILTENITGNNSPTYTFETGIDNYQSLRITILKWSIPLRRARLVEVDFGVVKEYSGDKLISLKIIEEMDLLANTVPSNEMTFVLDNSDSAFNILNPVGIYRFLKNNQEMSASIGLEVAEGQTEYIQMGKYYLSEWTTEEGAMTASFIGRNIFSKIDKEVYTNSLQNTNLYDLAVDVLLQANVGDYVLHDGLRDIPTLGFKEDISAREALQMIAIAGKSIVRQSRSGSLTFENFDELRFETGYITFTGDGHYAGMTTPQVYIDYTFQAIDFENAYEIPKISLAPTISHLVFVIDDGVAEPYNLKFVNGEVKQSEGFEINNPLITSDEHASDVAEWMFREYNHIAEYQAYWRQNPALECGNVLLIQDSYGSKKKARITKQEFNFVGYLDGTTEAKGGF